LSLRDRARTLLKGWGPAAVSRTEYYRVACPLGHPLQGQRTEGYQALRCPSCGEGIFVLPRSPLPEPPASEKTRSHPKSNPAEPLAWPEEPVALTDPAPNQQVTEREADAEIEWEDVEEEFDPSAPDETASAPNEPNHQAPSEPKTTRRREAGSRSSKAVATEDDLEFAPVQERLTLAEWARKRRNSLIFLGVGLLVLCTLGYRFWRNKREELPRIAEIGRTQGLPALDEGRFDTAHQLLAPAKRAVVALGDAYQGASEIKQGADEAEIYAKLVPDSLESILSEAARYDPKEWPSRFATLYKGRTVIIDAHITGTPREKRPAYELDYRIFEEGEGGKPRRMGRIDTTGFRLFEITQPKVGDHVQFGAELSAFEFDEVTEEWWVRLKPDSGVIMTHLKALEAIGWPTGEDSP